MGGRRSPFFRFRLVFFFPFSFFPFLPLSAGGPPSFFLFFSQLGEMMKSNHLFFSQAEVGAPPLFSPSCSGKLRAFLPWIFRDETPFCAAKRFSPFLQKNRYRVRSVSSLFCPLGTTSAIKVSGKSLFFFFLPLLLDSGRDVIRAVALLLFFFLFQFSSRRRNTTFPIWPENAISSFPSFPF